MSVQVPGVIQEFSKPFFGSVRACSVFFASLEREKVELFFNSRKKFPFPHSKLSSDTSVRFECCPFFRGNGLGCLA